MSASEAPAFDAIAIQLAAALEQYEQGVSEMIDTWLDTDRYQEVSQQIEDIRMLSAAMPSLSIHWVELLIAHAELVHSLWRLRFQDGGAQREKLDEVRARHADCVASLRGRCIRLLTRPDGAPR